MASINPLTSVASQAATSGPGDRIEELGKTEFLKLLVVQLENQDPFSPLKNEDFIAQLATFSSLEQLISINGAVTKLSEAGPEEPPPNGGSSANTQT